MSILKKPSNQREDVGPLPRIMITGPQVERLFAAAKISGETPSELAARGIEQVLASIELKAERAAAAHAGTLTA